MVYLYEQFHNINNKIDDEDDDGSGGGDVHEASVPNHIITKC